MWRVGEGEAAPGPLGNGQRDVGAAEIEAALRLDRTARLFQQQPDAGAIEERQVAEAIEFRQAENIRIERLRTIDIADRQRDLSDVPIEKHRVCLWCGF